MSEPTRPNPPKSNNLAQIIAYTAARYNLTNGTQPALALAFAAIMIQTREFRLSSEHTAEDALDRLNKPRTDPDLTKAAKEVLEHLGGAQP